MKARIQRAVDAAEARTKADADPLHMFEHVYAEMPRHLSEQREELRQELESPRGEEEPENVTAPEMIGRAA